MLSYDNKLPDSLPLWKLILIYLGSLAVAFFACYAAVESAKVMVDTAGERVQYRIRQYNHRKSYKDKALDLEAKYHGKQGHEWEPKDRQDYELLLLSLEEFRRIDEEGW